MYRRPGIVTSIGSKLGNVAEVSIVEPTINREATVWIKFIFDVYDVIILTKSVKIIKGKPPVELDFRYAGLQKFCTLCGSLQHEYELCKDYLLLSQRQYEFMDIGTNPYKTVEERNADIGEYITSREVGESSGTEATNMEEAHNTQMLINHHGDPFLCKLIQ